MRCGFRWLTRLAPAAALGLLCWLWTPLSLAQQAVPALHAHVVDLSQTLSAEQTSRIENKLTAFERDSGSQIVVLLVPTTQPEDIASYANRVANAWKIGRREVGDGVLLIVAKNERQLRIEVAKTLEGALPDLAARHIIDQAITPQFRQGDFAAGLDAGIDQIMARIKGEALPMPAPKSNRNGSALDWNDLAVLLFVGVPLLGMFTRRLLGAKLGSVATGTAAGAIALLFTSSVLIAGLAALVALLFTLFSNVAPHGPRSGWGGGFGGWGGGGWGGGSGGFGSGGGGDFGGGGASGNW